MDKFEIHWVLQTSGLKQNLVNNYKKRICPVGGLLRSCHSILADLVSHFDLMESQINTLSIPYIEEIEIIFKLARFASQIRKKKA